MTGWEEGLVPARLTVTEAGGDKVPLPNPSFAPVFPVETANNVQKEIFSLQTGERLLGMEGLEVWKDSVIGHERAS